MWGKFNPIPGFSGGQKGLKKPVESGQKWHFSISLITFFEECLKNGRNPRDISPFWISGDSQTSIN